jgi:hypothetical protein
LEYFDRQEQKAGRDKKSGGLSAYLGGQAGGDDAVEQQNLAPKQEKIQAQA